MPYRSTRPLAPADRHRREAERCERLGAAVYDTALATELFRLAAEHRARSWVA